MAADYDIYRKYELSIIRKLKENLNESIIVTDEEPDFSLEIPTASLRISGIGLYPFQHGSEYRDLLNWYITVYGKSRTQRDYMMIEIRNILANLDSITVYDFNDIENFDTEVSPPELGGLYLKGKFYARPFRMPKEITEKLRFRAAIEFSTFFN
jgi:hypothetical protein